MLQTTSPRLRRLALTIVALTSLGACADRDSASTADTLLAEDLALAQSVDPQPLFRDTAVATVTEPARRLPEARTPAPQPVRERATPRAATRRPPAAAPPQPLLEPEPEAEPAPVIATPAPVIARGIAAGTGMRLTTGAAVCTATNRPGDKIVATLDEAVRGEDGSIVPAGSKVVLEVASMRGGEKPENIAIAFRVRSLSVNGQNLPLAAEVAVLDTLDRTRTAGEKKSDAKKVVGGAIAGAVLGQVLGKDTKGTVIGAAAGAAAGTIAARSSDVYDACLRQGAAVRLTLVEPLVIAGR